MTADEVRAVALAYVKSQLYPVTINYSLLRVLAERLDLVLDDNTTNGRLNLYRFTGQVRRELDKLADRGELAKDIYHRAARFWKPEAYEAHLAAEAAKRAERDADRRFWLRIGQELALYGFQSTAGPGKPLQFSHDTWLAVIEAVEAARAAKAAQAGQ